MASNHTQTVLGATRDLMRGLGLTTVFGNPGSTEEPFLENWPSDHPIQGFGRPCSFNCRSCSWCRRIRSMPS